jgi:Cu-Zn family superoxide dismutase
MGSRGHLCGTQNGTRYHLKTARPLHSLLPMILWRSIPIPLLLFVLSSLILLLVGGCTRAEIPAADAGALPPEGGSSNDAAGVHVMVMPTAGHTASGMLLFSDSPAGLRVTGRIHQLPADRSLGFHIHTTGDCSAPDASSAGDHFDPSQQPHGDPASDRHHAGDMPNLSVNAEGAADVDLTIAGVTLEGPSPFGVRNRAVIVHARVDDYKTQPGGDAGDRIACGVIGAPLTVASRPTPGMTAGPRS